RRSTGSSGGCWATTPGTVPPGSSSATLPTPDAKRVRGMAGRAPHHPPSSRPPRTEGPNPLRRTKESFVGGEVQLATSRLRSRRRPRLRVVGTAPHPGRHESVVRELNTPFILRVWTFEEWERLAESERPEMINMLPGIGVCTLDVTDEDDEEALDVQDVCNQA